MPFSVTRSTEIRDRRDFAALCNFHDLKQAYEVGVYLGSFAEDFMKSWRGDTLHLVDPYEPYSEMPWDRTADLATAVNRLAKYGERVKFYRYPSPRILDVMNPLHVVQFVYIDGSHDYQSVKDDIDAWWKRLAVNGILAGHDYDDEHDGVCRAVNEFGKANDLEIYLTYEAGTSPSWYCYKKEKTDGRTVTPKLDGGVAEVSSR